MSEFKSFDTLIVWVMKEFLKKLILKKEVSR